MMADAQQVSDLRELLGESIPSDGSAADTLFTDDQVTRWLTQSATLNQAALKGWQIKMAHFADLVDVVDGASARSMSDLLDHAEKMVKLYTRLAQGPTAGRSRVGKIVRT